MFCQECGKELKDGSAFCPYCGTRQDNCFESEDVNSYEPTTSYGPENTYGSSNGYEPTDNYGTTNNYGQANNYEPTNNYGQANNYDAIYNNEPKTMQTSFCPYCGRPMYNNTCDCPGFQNAQKKKISGLINNASKKSFFVKPANLNMSSFSSLVSSVRDMSGMSEPNSMAGDPFEHDIPIVPECIEPEENEIVIKQYNIAKLRSRLKFMKAEGRLMVTNRRVLFRAAGTSLTGNILQEHQFNVDEIGGVEMHKDYKFSFLNFFGCFIVAMLASTVVGGMLAGLIRDSFRSGGGIAVMGILFTLFGIVFMAPTFVVYKHFWMKYFFSSISTACFVFSAAMFYKAKWIFIILAFVAAIFNLINMIVICFVPNLVLKIKTKGAGGAVVIGCQKAMFRRRTGDDYSGFSEVLPWDDTIMAMNELGTIIDDLQKQGDYAVKKWATAAVE